MKKIKFITSLSILGVLATATPFIATSCSSNAPVEKSTECKIFGDTIEGLNFAYTKYVGTTYTSLVKLRTSSGLLSPATFKIEERTDARLNATIDGNYVSITPSEETVGKTCILAIGAYVNGVKKAGITYALSYFEERYDIQFGKWSSEKVEVGKSAKLQVCLFCNGKNVSNVRFEVAKGTSESLNASANADIVTITPNLDAVKKNNKLVINAYWNGEYSTTKEIEFNNVIVTSNYMRYDGQDYELDPEINPRLFETQDARSYTKIHFVERNIPLKNGKTLHIDANQESWDKLTNLYLVTYSETKSFVIGFLSYCRNLREVSLNGLTDLTYTGVDFLSHCPLLKVVNLSKLTNLWLVGEDFLSYCHSLETLILPNKTPLTVVTPCTGIMEELPETTTIYCGDYLHLYKVADFWNKWSVQMIDLITKII